MAQDKLIIEAKGKRVEIPLHMVKLELHKNWGKEKGPLELVIRAIATSEEEGQQWGELYGLVC